MKLKKLINKGALSIEYVILVVGVLVIGAAAVLFATNKMNEVSGGEIDTTSDTGNVALNYNYRDQTYTIDNVTDGQSDVWLAGYNFGVKPSGDTSYTDGDYVSDFRKIKSNNYFTWKNAPTKSENGLEEFIYYYITSDPDTEGIREQILAAVESHGVSTSATSDFCIQGTNTMKNTEYGPGDIFDMPDFTKSYNAFLINYEINDSSSTLDNLIIETIQKKEVEFLKGYNIGNIISEYPYLEIKNTLVIPGYDYVNDYTNDNAPIYVYGIKNWKLGFGDYIDGASNTGEYLETYEGLVQKVSNKYFNGEYSTEGNPDTDNYNSKLLENMQDYLNENPNEKSNAMISENVTAEFADFLDDAETLVNDKINKGDTDYTLKDVRTNSFFSGEFGYLSLKKTYTKDEAQIFIDFIITYTKDVLEEEYDIDDEDEGNYVDYASNTFFEQFDGLSSLSWYKDDFKQAFLIGVYSGQTNKEMAETIVLQAQADRAIYNKMVSDGSTVDSEIDGARMARLLDMSQNAGYWYQYGWN